MTVPCRKSLSSSTQFANVCPWRLHGCVLDYIHLSAIGVAEIAESFQPCRVDMYNVSRSSIARSALSAL